MKERAASWRRLGHWFAWTAIAVLTGAGIQWISSPIVRASFDLDPAACEPQGSAVRHRAVWKGRLTEWEQAHARVTINGMLARRVTSDSGLVAAGPSRFRVHPRSLRFATPEGTTVETLSISLPWKPPDALFWVAAIAGIGGFALAFRLSRQGQRAALFKALIGLCTISTGLLLAAESVSGWPNPTLPYLENDSGGYLMPAANLHAHGEARIESARSPGYPLLLAGFLEVGGMRVVIVLQKALAVAANWLIAAALWWIAVRWLRWPMAVSSVLALACLRCQLDSVSSAYYPSVVMTESVAPIFLAGMLALGVAAWHSPARGWADWRLFAIAAFGLALWWIRPAAILVCCFPLAIAGWQFLWSPRRRTAAVRFALLALCIVGTVAALRVAEPRLRDAGSERTPQRFAAETLFLWHLNIVEPWLRGKAVQTELDRELLRLIEQERARTSIEGPGIYLNLGYDPDRMMHRTTDFRDLRRRLALTPAEWSRELSEIWRNAVLSRPIAYVTKILRELRLAYDPWAGVAAARLVKDWDVLARKSRVYAAGIVDDIPAAEPLLAGYKLPIAGRETDERSVNRVHEAIALMNRWQPIRVGIGLVGVCLILAIAPLRRLCGSTAAFLAIVLFAFQFALLLAPAMSHSLHLRRYIDIALPVTWFLVFGFAALAMSAFAFLAVHIWKGWRGRSSSQSGRIADAA